MKRNFYSFIFSFLLVQINYLSAQNNFSISKERIAIFAPLYLDSAFDVSNNYRYGINFPNFMNPGLEFYEGAQLALDTLAKENAQLEIFVFDTRSSAKSLKEQLKQAATDSVQMLIAYTETVTELQQLASSAQEMKIPFISVNLPNDGGVYNNPYFVILNSTLRTHIEAIYHYIQKFYPLDDIIVFRKKGQVEDLIQSYFNDAGKSTVSVPLKLKFADLTDSFTVNQLTGYLDSNRHVLCIAGSLDENFGKRLVLQLASLSGQYPVTLMGMPTFDNMDKEFSRPEFKGPGIIYSTSFYNPRTDKVSQRITSWFHDKIYTIPGEMVMQGYEAVWRFAKLLLQYKTDIASNLTRKEYNVFRDFDIQPVISKKNMTLDYFENKKLFFVTWLNGLIKSVN